MAFHKSATKETILEVGVRNLRNNLSRHLTEVREGHTITVTDHGKPIARLVPVEGLTPYERLKAEGRITPALKPGAEAPAPVDADVSLSEIVLEMRREEYR